MRVENKTKLKQNLQVRKDAMKDCRCNFVGVPNTGNESTLQPSQMSKNNLDPLTAETKNGKQTDEREGLDLVGLLEVTMEEGDKQDDSVFTCTECNGKFKLYSDLCAHQLLHHVKRKRRRRCEIPENLDPSVLPNQCSVCKKVLSKKSALSAHMLIHTGDSPYECNICKKKCKTQGNINIHMRIHTGERPYECDICHWKCQTVSHLKKHKVKHSIEKSYQCDFCKKKFKTLDHLRRHKLVHMDNRPYVCTLCSKKYTQRNHLNKHMTVKHPGHL